MEPKQIVCECDQSSCPLAEYDSFIARNLESYYELGLKERQLRASSHGWVILSTPDKVLWTLWNPLTSKTLHLPPLWFEDEEATEYSYYCCLPSPPGEQGSVLLLAPTVTFTFVFCRLDCKRKKFKWTEMSYAKQLWSMTGINGCYLTNVTCCNGKVYAVNSDADYPFLIQVDIMVKGKELVITLLPFVAEPRVIPSDYPFATPFLIGSHTELFYIVLCPMYGTQQTVEVSLSKFDVASMMFEEMEDLNDAAFFVDFANGSPPYSLYKSVVASNIGGYVHILDDKNQICSFRVKDRTMSLPSKSCIVQESHGFVWKMLAYGLKARTPEIMQEKEYKDKKIVVKPVKLEGYSTTRESRLLNIPFHILETIMEHCLGVEYLKFRATCNRCRLAAPLTQWSSKTALRRLRMYSVVSPWLMVFDNHRGVMTFIDPVCGDMYYIKPPQEFNDRYKIYCSRYGWLLMARVTGDVVFYNPFTSEIRKLPALHYGFESFCFSAPPASPDCVVAAFYKKRVVIHDVSQPSWRRYVLGYGETGPFSFHFPAFSGPDIYTLRNNDKRIEAFSSTNQNLSRRIVVDNAPSRCPESSREYFMSNCDEHLLLVIVGESGRSVEVFKLNNSTKEWDKLDGLGKHMIFIADASCICLEAKLQEMENKIYFPRLLRNDDTKVVFYSLETCRYHTFDDKRIRETFSGDLLKTVKSSFPHTWIEPSWYYENTHDVTT